MSEWAEWVEILWGSTKFYFKQMLKVSAFYLQKKKKSFIPKKKILAVVSKYAKKDPKAGVLLSQFSMKVLACTMLKEYMC